MNEFIVLVASVGLGGVTWVMLMFSDWLLRDDQERLPVKAASRPRRANAKQFGFNYSLTSRSHR